MSKRTDTIRSLFTAPIQSAVAAENKSGLPRVSASPVRAMSDSLTGIERENQALREAIASGSSIIEIDPSTIDPSPIMDRFTDTDPTSFDALKASIRANGQEVPVLVRVHPKVQNRYQAAYGHRRIRACLELGRPVKAIVRPLSDRDSAIAQGIENSARQDLTCIERAVFAMRLEEAGHDRAVVQEALSIDRAEASKLISIARGLPADFINLIGRAPKIGRARWLSLVDALKSDTAITLARNALTALGPETDSDARFLTALAAATQPNKPDQDVSSWLETATGNKFARLTTSTKEVHLVIDRKSNPGFADYLIAQLPRLFETYRAGQPEEAG